MVTSVVLLDAGPIGMATNPRPSPKNLACTEWLSRLVDQGVRVVIPEIADYEVRRELLRVNKVKGLIQLDQLCELLEYLPITTAAMRQAAQFWAVARQHGQPTAGDKTLDADVILAGQVVTLDDPDVVVATTNVGHLSRFVTARIWEDIVVD